MVNDTVIDGPKYSVPLWMDIPNPLDGPSLCYEVIGSPNKAFNILSDTCTSINAYYSTIVKYSKVISKIGIVAKDANGQCKNILVNVDRCAASIDNIEVVSYQQNGIAIQKTGLNIKITVPNCGNPNLVSLGLFVM